MIGKLDEFPDDTRRVVDIDGVDIAVFNVGGTFHAMRNACPHKSAPLCTNATGMMLESAPDVYDWGREGEIVRCPWHGFEFNLSDGKSVVAPQLKLRARVYKVDIEGEEVALYV
ncbi:Rieske (2Fe-2S) protein [Rhodococcus opacus]|uniref:Rieske (2Fe-2S) protein n=1 Tax=Rhodococcus opacus TaxID=37919 RepID=UPI001F57BA68|nr:Rieske (2Fe-2S) protein [Rhodococcus opacus]UNM99401.1 Rieske (2Fe-2S) protein [Rhodococcus opacus]